MRRLALFQAVPQLVQNDAPPAQQHLTALGERDTASASLEDRDAQITF
jgi:hypothetical protein